LPLAFNQNYGRTAHHDFDDDVECWLSDDAHLKEVENADHPHHGTDSSDWADVVSPYLEHTWLAGSRQQLQQHVKG
jgi:hypothetical protein